ncbi:DUF3147 family protein [Granulicella sp. 5B5]|uniref:DUF3147 family protein n=1 Tax=Granulicella sp. 5B5 TaxID=1617967 RepID=UPI0015F64835|nr:DUF3147 family protein [Granulicella sp. 5B5]QMV19196.1 DUF3147 family protein [Granulicella sp. 5B5]
MRLRFDSLRETTLAEYARHFVAGGLVTVAASLIARRYGAVIGGMFMAFPGIFPPSISLVEKHKREREAAQGFEGVRAARAEASVEAAGASAGAAGLGAFGLVLWKGLGTHPLTPVLVVALMAWLVVSCTMWWLRERL